ncbi:vancomycin C-type resistance protein VanC [Abditibacteriota bacterium]|nr:vancomycin C-type resistance protein VanC [Abditibacteriota bacterium]
MHSKISVAVLLGGDSSERSVSLMSGRAVAEAFDPTRFTVTCFDVNDDISIESLARPSALGEHPSRPLFPLAWKDLIVALDTNGFDVVFPVLHGGRGEDGTLQHLLEVARLKYVGSPARACTIAIDKPLAKSYLSTFGIPSPRGFSVSALEELGQHDIPFPCVVKPAGGGSSVGVTILQSHGGLEEAVGKSLADGSGALIEEFIPGVEVTCTVMGEGATARALPAIEIVPKLGDGFYDFEAKYAKGGSDHLIPPRISDGLQVEVAGMALRAHQLLGCRGVTRSDFLVSDERGAIYLETNTSPGMTSTSLVPDAARAIGWDFPQLVEKLVLDALGQTA